MSDEKLVTVVFGDGTKRRTKMCNVTKVIKSVEEIRKIARKAVGSEEEVELLSVTIVRDEE